MAPPSDYEPVAQAFVAARSPTIGAAAVRAWAEALPKNARVLDLGCGHGVPVARALAEAGCAVHGVDTSHTLLAAFRRNVPGATAQRADATTLDPEPGAFDGVVAWGLLFLLDPVGQAALLHRAAAALRPGGSFLATAPWQAAAWTDTLTGRRCVSLGRAGYRDAFAEAGFVVTGEGEDEGGNHYWVATRDREARR